MCVGVPDSCEGYGYSQTLLPNKFGHNSTADVSLMLDSLNPLKVNFVGIPGVSFLLFHCNDMHQYETLLVTSHINCIVGRCLINFVYLTTCAFIRS